MAAIAELVTVAVAMAVVTASSGSVSDSSGGSGGIDGGIGGAGGDNDKMNTIVFRIHCRIKTRIISVVGMILPKMAYLNMLLELCRPVQV